jgi:hypothetical protein
MEATAGPGPAAPPSSKTLDAWQGIQRDLTALAASLNAAAQK